VNILATLVRYLPLTKVNYYSIQLEDRERCEYDRLLLKLMESEDSVYIEIIEALLELFGDRGVRKEYIRQEKNAGAFIPPANIVREFFDDIIPNDYRDLRVYLCWLNENNVVLFNGGIKTAQTAQACPNLSKAFHEATVFCAFIKVELNLRDIKLKDLWEELQHEFCFDIPLNKLLTSTR